MPTEAEDLGRTVVRRIFATQIVLVATILLLMLLGHVLETIRGPGQSPGFDFWFAFIAGCLGSSLCLLKRVAADALALREAGRSRTDTLMPILYGGILAGVAYLLFMSGLLSGPNGSGLLTTNLFPTFELESLEQKTIVSAYLGSRPASIPDVGKLLVWCFLAGYSEKFVIGILGRLERSHSEDLPS